MGLLRFYSVLFLLTIFSLYTANISYAASNLVTNPGAETNNISGWGTGGAGGSWSAGGYNHSGDRGFAATYSWGSLNQEIDLVAKGYSTATLDTAPKIRVGSFVTDYWGYGVRYPTYQFKVELRNASHAVITSYNSGVQNITDQNIWHELTNTFTAYGAGVRYIYVEIGAQDGRNWGGNYGPNFDDVTVLITDNSSDKILRYNPSSINGYIYGNSPQVVVNNGTGTSVAAIARSGYIFSNWSDGSTANPRTDSSVTADNLYTANFVQSFTLTYTAGANGSIGGSAIQSVNTGGSGTPVIAIGNSGYSFTSWSDGGSSNPRTDTNVQNNIGVTASFSANNYTLTFDPQSGTVNPTTKSVAYNSTVGALPTPTRNGFTFSGWNTISNGSGTTYTTSTVYPFAGNTTLYAQWTLNTYTLSYTAGANGSIAGTTPQTVNSGGSGTAIIPNPATHFHFVNWSDGSTATPRIDSNVSQNIGVTANFSIDTFTLTFLAGSHGSIGGTAIQTIQYGADSSSVNVTADSGYHFTNWSDGNAQNPRQILMVISNKTLTANFVANDVDAPVISIVTSSPGSTTADISWITNEDSSSLVQYGLNINYGFSTTETDTSSPGLRTPCQSLQPKTLCPLLLSCSFH